VNSSPERNGFLFFLKKKEKRERKRRKEWRKEDKKKNSRACSEASVLNGQAMILNGLTLKATYEDH
jgi:hypothetical protein